MMVLMFITESIFVKIFLVILLGIIIKICGANIIKPFLLWLVADVVFYLFLGLIGFSFGTSADSLSLFLSNGMSTLSSIIMFIEIALVIAAIVLIVIKVRSDAQESGRFRSPGGNRTGKGSSRSTGRNKSGKGDSEFPPYEPDDPPYDPFGPVYGEEGDSDYPADHTSSTEYKTIREQIYNEGIDSYVVDRITFEKAVKSCMYYRSRKYPYDDIKENKYLVESIVKYTLDERLVPPNELESSLNRMIKSGEISCKKYESKDHYNQQALDIWNLRISVLIGCLCLIPNN